MSAKKYSWTFYLARTRVNIRSTCFFGYNYVDTGVVKTKQENKVFLQILCLFESFYFLLQSISGKFDPYVHTQIIHNDIKILFRKIMSGFRVGTEQIYLCLRSFLPSLPAGEMNCSCGSATLKNSILTIARTQLRTPFFY